MSVLRILLLPLTIPSWIGCKTSEAMAVSIDGAVSVGEGARRRFGGRGSSPRNGA